MEFGTTANSQPIRIELGSGPHGEPGYFHVDAVKVGNVDKEADVRKLDWLPDNSVDELYSAHTVEHISYTEVEAVLREWSRVLKPGGTLTVKMPDLDFMCRAYVEKIHSPEEVMVCLYGGFADRPGAETGWDRIAGAAWERNTIKDGEIVHPGVYTEWEAHKALYTENMFRVRLLRNNFNSVRRIIENDWELHMVATK